MDGVRAVKHMARLSEWKERIIVCRNSGQPVQRWCEQNGINPKTYYRWERLLMAEAVKIAAGQRSFELEAFPGSMASKPSVQATQSQVPCIVKLDCEKVAQREEYAFKLNGVEIIVSEDVSPAFLRKLLEAAAHAR
mgnify:FL=1